MPTKKPRFNITFDSKELISKALARHEDRALSKIADSRIKEARKKSRKNISHENAWK